MKSDAKSLLARVGLRKTPTMLALLECLARQLAPVTHRYLAEELALTGHEPSTVFRCLRRLEEKGVVVKLDLGEHVDRYELLAADGGDTSEGHPHFLCILCGEILCLEKKSVSSVTLKSLHPRIGDVSLVVLKGRCRTCCKVSGGNSSDFNDRNG